jgi:CheY-like chemotaxis protein
MADRGQLHQVLMNLLANARDAMPGGGKIVIETRAMALDEATARENGGLPLGQYVLLSVADTGPGMSALIREHIFEPFFTTKKKGEGTGLGLSIVYGIVRHSGGWITVDSEPGKGSTFRVLLPRAAAGVRERPVVALRSPDAAGGETLLLVEDQDEVREFAARVLQGRGYRVLLAAGGEAALALAGEFREPIHLLVTDVVLPGMSGYQIAGRLRESRPGIKVLYASGYPEAVIQQHRGLDVAVEVMRKPFAPDELAAKVREVLGS